MFLISLVIGVRKRLKTYDLQLTTSLPNLRSRLLLEIKN